MGNEFITAEIKGLDTLQHNLEALDSKLQKKGLRAALRAGGNVFRKGMVELAPKATGFLSEHFGVKIKLLRNALGGSAYIGPQGKIDYPDYASGAYRIKRIAGKARKVGRIAVATVARFLEFGTSKMTKKPFMTQAGDSYKENALQAVISSLKDSLDL